MHNVLTLILAGGKGTRLEPLTKDRAKPSVPFGGTYRIIDFPLSNCLNSNLRRIFVLTQYKATSLDRHIRQGWQFLCRELDEFVDVLAPQQRIGEHWYRGTADAVYQNIYTIEQYDADHLVILAGDHIYKMDYSQMVAQHIERNADCTIGCLPVSMEEGRSFGVMGVDDELWVRRFEEKPP
ncbi:MAG: NTP transferase domain-containing protein, partial [Planctomycetaceae bacterium]|nr:NTP transferase domain-containing protein [Planctomycetaceae bacterium]